MPRNFDAMLAALDAVEKALEPDQAKCPPHDIDDVYHAWISGGEAGTATFCNACGAILFAMIPASEFKQASLNEGASIISLYEAKARMSNDD